MKSMIKNYVALQIINPSAVRLLFKSFKRDRSIEFFLKALRFLESNTWYIFYEISNRIYL